LVQPFLRALKHHHNQSSLLESYSLKKGSLSHHIKTTICTPYTIIKLLQTTTHLGVSPWLESYNLEELIPSFSSSGSSWHFIQSILLLMNYDFFPFQSFNNLNFNYNVLWLQSSRGSLAIFDLHSPLSHDWLINIWKH